MSPAETIVLVEDDPNDVAVALRAFRRNHLADRVVVLRDGEQALDYLLGSARADGVPAPSVVFLDLKMPKVGGFDVLRELRADDRLQAVPVVVVSSSDRDADIRESYRLGANSFLLKRFEPGRPGEFLVDAARYWLGLNRLPGRMGGHDRCTS